MYKGYIEVTPTDTEWAELYEHPENNIYGCLNNQYLLVSDTNNIVDRFKWVNNSYKRLSYKQINNLFVSAFFEVLDNAIDVNATVWIV